jgi:hypothetical protein
MEMTHDPNRQELIKLLSDLLALLSDPDYHPGLMGWMIMYNKKVTELLNFFKD